MKWLDKYDGISGTEETYQGVHIGWCVLILIGAVVLGTYCPALAALLWLAFIVKVAIELCG